MLRMITSDVSVQDVSQVIVHGVKVYLLLTSKYYELAEFIDVKITGVEEVADNYFLLIILTNKIDEFNRFRPI